jgi:hypothetical protein
LRLGGATLSARVGSSCGCSPVPRACIATKACAGCSAAICPCIHSANCASHWSSWTDLETGRAMALSEGDLIEAVLASTALPGLFPPISWNGLNLVDGGLSDNVPIDLAVGRGAKRVIGMLCGCAKGFAGPANTFLAGFFVGLLWANAFEYLYYRFLLHMLGNFAWSVRFEPACGKARCRARDLLSMGYKSAYTLTPSDVVSVICSRGNATIRFRGIRAAMQFTDDRRLVRLLARRLW